MAEQFYTILTKHGKNEVAIATQRGTKVDFKYLALGDGRGNYQNPTENDLKLVREVYRGVIANVSIDTINRNWVKMSMIIPANVGGFMIREVGIFDNNNKMLAIGKYPETYKPIIQHGSSKDLTINMIMEVANAGVVKMEIDPYVVIATKRDIVDHSLEDLPHSFLDKKTGKRYYYGYQLSKEGKPQLIYGEVI